MRDGRAVPALAPHRLDWRRGWPCVVCGETPQGGEVGSFEPGDEVEMNA